MTPREKILLALMGVSLVFGSANLLVSTRSGQVAPATPPPPSSLVQQARDVANEIVHAAASLGLKPEQRYVFAAAGRPVTENPFFLRQAPALPVRTPRNRLKQSGTSPSPVYSGYIAMGTQRLAIIGGLEYAVGDRLPETGDLIHAIKPDKVILHSPEHDVWELPYSGDDL